MAIIKHVAAYDKSNVWLDASKNDPTPLTAAPRYVMRSVRGIRAERNIFYVTRRGKTRETRAARRNRSSYAARRRCSHPSDREFRLRRVHNRGFGPTPLLLCSRRMAFVRPARVRCPRTGRVFRFPSAVSAWFRSRTQN